MIRFRNQNHKNSGYVVYRVGGLGWVRTVQNRIYDHFWHPNLHINLCTFLKWVHTFVHKFLCRLLKFVHIFVHIPEPEVGVGCHKECETSWLWRCSFQPRTRYYTNHCLILEYLKTRSSQFFKSWTSPNSSSTGDRSMWEWENPNFEWR
jgi:hypothetical protein